MAVPLRDKLRNKDCKLCKLYKTAQAVCLIGDGPYPTKIMLIGEAPGKREDDMNRPFAGKAGKILDVLLEEVDLSRDELYITNIVHCRPPENRKPNMEEIRSCRPTLLKEIKAVNPKIIITLGDTALKGLFDSNLLSIGKERGKILDWEGKKVIVTYHPAAALRNNYYANLILDDLKRGLDKTSSVTVKEQVHYQLVTPKFKTQITEQLYNATKISVDLETTGFDYMDEKKELISINTSLNPGSSYIWKPGDLETVKKILENKKLLINHNIKFDLQWLDRYGIHPKGAIFDTMVAKHLLDENYPDKDLKHLSRIELNMTDLSEMAKVMEKHRKADTHPSWDELVRYGGGDSDAAFRLYEHYKPQLEEQGLLELMHTEMKVLKTLTKMEIQGIQIDLKQHKKLMKKYKEEIDIAAYDMTAIAGDINLNSPKQVAELLYNTLKLPILKKTDNGAPSCDEGTLLLLSGARNLSSKQREALDKLLTYRSLAKIYSVYLEGLVKNNYLKSDGRLHCDFKICGTKTGRLSCAEPNLQNIPRNGDIKSMFISSFTGGSLIQLDYSQMELRILAHYSGDKALIEAFRKGRDIHRETTAKCLHKDYNKVTEEERKIIGKRVNFGIVYLISPAGLADKIGCSTEEAKEYIKNWYDEFHEVKEWMKDRREMILATGKSPSYNGRIRRLYGASMETSEGREAIRQGTNSPIQGGAGDITKYSMMKLDRKLRKEGYEAKVVINVHDAVIVDCPKKEVKEVIRIMQEVCVEPPIPLLVPLEFDIKIGPNWKDMEETCQKRKPTV